MLKNAIKIVLGSKIVFQKYGGFFGKSFAPFW